MLAYLKCLKLLRNLEESAKSGVNSEEINSLANKVSEYLKKAIHYFI